MTRIDRTGLALALCAFVIWAFLPLLFKNIHGMNNVDLLAWRILSSLTVLIVVATALRIWPAIADALLSPRTVGTLIFTASLNLLNWLTFIIGTRSGHVLEISLGYFMNPLVNVALGVVVLREHMNRTQGFAIGLAAVGVLALAIYNGGALWISLTLAITFAIYGLVRKTIAIAPLEGLTVEMILLGPVSASYLTLGSATAVDGLSPHNIALLALAGPLTALPLFLYSAASRRMPFSTLGMIQYSAPTLQFFLAIWLGEHLHGIHLVAFAFIWTALAIFAADSLKRARALSAAKSI